MGRALSPTQVALLAAVRISDEDEGGLDYDELGEDARDDLDELSTRELVEVRATADGTTVRITWRGVDALRDLGLRRE